MRTSSEQFALMVEFMERNGDLSKPGNGPRGRAWSNKKWRELSEKLNSEGTGASRDEEKWRKVWSDLKNNTKKKWAKINRSMQGTGGGPAITTALTSLENRVMALVGTQAASGIVEVEEIGFPQTNEQSPEPGEQAPEAAENITVGDTYSWPLLDEDSWNTPSSSAAPTRGPRTQTSQLLGSASLHWPTSSNAPSPAPVPAPSPSPLPAPAPAAARSPRPGSTSPVPPASAAAPASQATRRQNRKRTAEDAFVSCERYAREAERERDRMFAEIERERIRQRDVELQLQALWLDFMKDALRVIERFMNAHN